MCRKNPYPRCSSHARKQLENALKTQDADQIKRARLAYYTSPAGIKELRDAGKTETADRFAARRKTLIAKAKKANHTPLVVGLDLDETTGSFSSGLRNFLAEKYNLTAEEALERYPIPSAYSFVTSGWFATHEEFMSEFREAENKGIYRKMPAYQGAPRVLRNLVRDGEVVIRVVTARDQTQNADTMHWLRMHRIPVTSVTHTETKEETIATHGIDFYVDDSERQLTTLSTHGARVIAYDNDTNAHLTDLPHRMYNWDEFPALLKVLRKEKASVTA